MDDQQFERVSVGVAGFAANEVSLPFKKPDLSFME